MSSPRYPATVAIKRVSASLDGGELADPLSLELETAWCGDEAKGWRGGSPARGRSVEIPSARAHELTAWKKPNATPVRTRREVYDVLSLMSQLLTRRQAGMREFSVSFCSASTRTCWEVLTNTKHAWDS